MQVVREFTWGHDRTVMSDTGSSVVALCPSCGRRRRRDEIELPRRSASKEQLTEHGCDP